MRDENAIVRERQKAIRREMDRRGISLKAVSFDSGIPYATIVSYFTDEQNKEPATIGGAAIYALAACERFPLDLLSLLLPDGFQIVRAPEGIDHDVLCELASDYVAEKHRAHHPASEDGREISASEKVRLDGKAMRLVGSIAA